jgi:flagellar biosynthesis protein FlhF
MEMANLHLRINMSEAEPVLVITAGSDPMEVAGMARLYRELGVKKFIATQMDIARRAGSILTASDSASLALYSVSISAKVTDGMKSILPISLARLVMLHTDRNTLSQQIAKAVQ